MGQFMRIYKTECKMEVFFLVVNHQLGLDAFILEAKQEWKSSCCQEMRIVEKQH